MKNKLFKQLLSDFNEWLRRLNYATSSVKSRTQQLKRFLVWLENKGINRLDTVSEKELILYNEMLHQQPYNYQTIQKYLSALKLLNNYLESYGEPPLVKVKLEVIKGIDQQRSIISLNEITKLYAACEPNIYGKRDRVILAIYYGCGLRSWEGIRLKIEDLDFNNGLLHVRLGKNYRERHVPMSDGVRRELHEWTNRHLPYFSGKKTTILIPNRKGKMLHNSSINRRLKSLCEKAKVKQISLHCLRHSIATHLLESGMELEKISQFLGHKGLEATQVYTRIINPENE